MVESVRKNNTQMINENINIISEASFNKTKPNVETRITKTDQSLGFNLE